MVIVISLYWGITSINALIVIAGANVGMILFGWLQERMNPPGRTSTTMLPFWFGSLVGITPWVAMAVNLFFYSDVPRAIYAILIGQGLFFFCFGLNQWLQYKGIGRWADYAAGEKTYLVLSLGAKSLLAWQIFAVSLASWRPRMPGPTEAINYLVKRVKRVASGITNSPTTKSTRCSTPASPTGHSYGRSHPAEIRSAANPTLYGLDNGVKVTRSEPASSQLLADLRSDRNMAWVPQNAFFTHVAISAAAGELSRDLATDLAGYVQEPAKGHGSPRTW